MPSLEPLKDSLHFSRSERVGFWVLTLVMLFILALPNLWQTYHQPEPQSFDRLERALQAMSESQKLPAPSLRTLHNFDPNQVSEEALVQMGVPDRLARTWINYRNKTGDFKEAADLKKLYGMTDSLYQLILPHLQFTATIVSEKQAAMASAPERFSFDPNTVTQAELLRLGLSRRQAQTLVNYRNKGGQFRKAEELKKVYGISQELYQTLEAYIDIPSAEKPVSSLASSSASQPTFYDAPSRSVLRIDVNAATADEWQQLRGIGPAYAKRIVKFRDALGGFAHLDQIADTYGLPDSTFKSIRPFLISSPIFQYLNINQADAQTLSKHPYLNRRIAQTIVAYREKHGSFKNMDDLSKVYALSEKTRKQVEPYLRFDNK